MRGLGYVPVDEGEAEAQPDLPTITVRFVEGMQQPWAEQEWPLKVRFEAQSQTLGTKRTDTYLCDYAATWAADCGYEVEPGAKATWVDTEDDGRVRAVTLTMTGFVGAE